MAERTVKVEVVRAGIDRQIVRQTELPCGSTVRQAIEASGLADVDSTRLGIFSRRVSPDLVVQDGDRIEIYRPLLLDPMDARRQRAGKS